MLATVLPWHSLKTRITITTLCIFLTSLWALSFYANRTLHEDMERISGQQQFSTVSMIADQVNSALKDRFDALDILAGATAQIMLQGPAAVQTIITQGPALQTLFNGGVFVTRLDGTAIADLSPGAGRIGINYIDTDYIAVPLNEGRPMLGRPVISKSLKDPIVGMAVPVRDARGNVIGALAGVIDLSTPNFLDHITEGHYGNTGGYLIVAPQHRVIVTATEKARIMETSPAPGIHPEIDRFLNGYEGFSVFVNPVGVEVLQSAKGIPLARWYLAASLPTAEAFAPIQEMLKRLSIATLLLALAAGGLTWWLLRRQLSPLVNTAITLAGLSKKDEHPQPLPVHRRDEIGQLIDGFNHLLETLGKRERTLKESEIRYREIFDEAPISYHELDTDGRITRVNRTELSILGYPAEQMLGHHVWEFVEQGISSRQAVLNKLTGDLPSVKSFERIFCKNDGTLIPMLIQDKLLLDQEGKITGIRSTLIDITERKRMEADLENQLKALNLLNHEYKEINDKLTQAQNQLLQSEKLASIGLLAAGVAHEINNPIGFVNSNLGTLKNYVDDLLAVIDAYEKVEVSLPGSTSVFATIDALRAKVDLSFVKSDVHTLITESRSGLDRVKKIVLSLKDFARVAAEETFQAVDIHQGIESTLNVARNELKYKCEVRREYGNLPPVECMLSRLNQVFMNLLVNAAQSIENSGTITIRTGIQDEGIWVEIADTGKGIPAENLSRIFDPFFTTKPIGQGTGLGLSVSHGIVESHHGRIEVTSEVGTGTTFRICLPIRQTADVPANLP